MRIPKLPRTVRIICDEHHVWHDKKDAAGKVVGREKGDPLPNSPVFVCRPVPMLRATGYAVRLTENAAQAYAQVCLDFLVDVEELEIGADRFDRGNPEHIDTLEPRWCVDVGMQLLERTHLSDEEAGKSSSPSVSD